MSNDSTGGSASTLDQSRLAEHMAQLVVDKLDRRWPPNDVHRNHHVWTEAQIAARATFTGRKHRVIDYITGSVVMGFIGWLGYLILERLNLGG